MILIFSPPLHAKVAFLPSQIVRDFALSGAKEKDSKHVHFFLNWALFEKFQFDEEKEQAINPLLPLKFFHFLTVCIFFLSLFFSFVSHRFPIKQIKIYNHSFLVCIFCK